MRIRERQFGAITVLDLSGPIAGRAAAGAFEDAVRRHARAGTHTLVANLARVPSIDLGGLGALVNGSRTMREAAGVLSLACLTKRIHDLIVITRLLTVFDTFDSVEDAVGGRTEAAPGLSPAALGAIQRFLRRA